MVEKRVCVIVAAYNAAATIARAVRSALAEPEVAEVIVVDDASTDATADIAAACDDGSGRLIVHRLVDNAGPSAARNLALARSRASLVAILDADDFFLPGRFAALFAVPDWDMIADNIVFVDEAGAASIDPGAVAEQSIAPRLLTPAAFVDGCLTRRDRYKGELGFLKPVLSRAFLDTHRLRYAEGMRLSEDYDLYVRALMAGARFRLVSGCHYVAVERPSSLSSNHGVGELAAVDAAVGRLLAEAPPGDRALIAALRRHRAQTDRRYRHRALLERKHQVGLLRAMRETLRGPRELARVAIDIARDKLAAVRRPAASQPGNAHLRFLIDR